ncbi:MAG: LytTR family DNA-binding domain-containing protein [Clostridiales bacterium]|jgi:DNA-binding LytR/AlgR family response regulator|nr:LytTR family DNA-binding domain-containing protein [Eubacteriales bacterium]MDH7565982.1 LytTR family DNA-binding domain-containing protein [Clostridiales bacterium]
MPELLISLIDDDKELLYFYENEMEKIIQKNKLQAKIVCITNKTTEFLKIVEEGKTNVCFIDINLKCETNGMHLAENIRDLNVPVEIIFVTGHLQYMKNAFQVRAFDYIEKPVTTEVLEKCLLRLHKEIIQHTPVNRETIEIKSGPYVYYIAVNDIYYIEHNGLKTIIHSKNRTLETYDSLKTIADKLPEGKFKQCHRSFYINTDYIDRVSSKEILLTNGETCMLSEKFRKDFL